MIMKYVVMLFIACGLDIVVSELPTLQKGTTELSVVSYSPKKNVFVPYKLCLNSVPFSVSATVRTQDPSLPHKFKLTVIKEFSHGFNVELERTDQSAGWQEDLFVDWQFYSGGNGILLNGQYVWMPDPITPQSQTLAQAKASCTTLGASLLDIMDKTTYDKVYNYFMTRTYRSGPYADIWLAMTFNQTTKTPISSFGQPAYSGDWYPGYPSSISTNTAMLLQVKYFPESTWIGLWQLPPDQARSTYDLCVKIL